MIKKFRNISMLEPHRYGILSPPISYSIDLSVSTRKHTFLHALAHTSEYDDMLIAYQTREISCSNHYYGQLNSKGRFEVRLSFCELMLERILT
jgi:AICAR transformylase/IMP cyclohydrolase PurH